ncbi:hypothetical protein PR048_014407 [Dryococelus australis]|uniref:Uncharacterized protein n=1 Tax=Dryococelus australis TaxID=614101 RepID=A0ABQ9HE51_9NEOP|nr:hypothetical protein PR048_014407 [Dryococelus australis]
MGPNSQKKTSKQSQNTVRTSTVTAPSTTAQPDASMSSPASSDRATAPVNQNMLLPTSAEQSCSMEVEQTAVTPQTREHAESKSAEVKATSVDEITSILTVAMH